MRPNNEPVQIKDEPCIGCRHRVRCKVEHLACKEFYAYVMDDKRAIIRTPIEERRIPSRERYDMVWSGEGAWGFVDG